MTKLCNCIIAHGIKVLKLIRGAWKMIVGYRISHA